MHHQPAQHHHRQVDPTVLCWFSVLPWTPSPRKPRTTQSPHCLIRLSGVESRKTATASPFHPLPIEQRHVTIDQTVRTHSDTGRIAFRFAADSASVCPRIALDAAPFVRCILSTAFKATLPSPYTKRVLASGGE